MSTLKSVGNKLFKTELKSHKVELSLSDELKSLMSEINRIIDLQEDAFKWEQKTNDAHKEFLKVASDAQGIAISSVKNSKKTTSEGSALLKKVETSAKELGLEPNTVNGYKEAIVALNKLIDNQMKADIIAQTIQKKFL